MQHDLSSLILDLDSMVPRINAPRCEHTDEISSGAPCLTAGRLHIGEVEAQIVTAPTDAVAANVKEKARHGVC